MKSAAVTVATTPTLVVSADNKFRTVYLHNGGGAKIYLGDDNVTTTNGYHVANNEAVSIELPLGETLYACVALGTNDITVLTPDAD